MKLKKNRYNSSHRCTELPTLKLGDHLWVFDQKTPANVTEKAETPRSYVVETESGSPITRNRRHLVPIPESTSKMDKSPLKLVESHPAASVSESPHEKILPDAAKTTRSGRVMKPPIKFNL